MNNAEIYNIIIENKEQLKRVGYIFDEDNIENILNWFIKIATSMLSDGQRIANKDIRNFLLSLSPYKVEISKIDYETTPTCIDFNNTSNNNQKYIFNNIEESLNEFVLTDFYDNLENWNKKLIIRKNIQGKVVEKQLKDLNLLDKFNKWELTEKENQIIIKLLQKNV